LFENRFLKRIFGPKRDDVRGEWRKLHNESLHNFYSSPNITRQIKSRRMWHAREKREKCAWFLGGKPEGRRPLGRPRRRWEDVFRMDLGETIWRGV
jgi:hypothetical protein